MISPEAKQQLFEYRAASRLENRAAPFSIGDILDLPRLQELTRSVSDATGMTLALVTIDGEVLVGSGWRRICTAFHRTHPDTEKDCMVSDTRISAAVRGGAPFAIYKCPRGLTDACVPIVIDGYHAANMFIGQFFTEPPNRETEKFFRDQAARFGLDERDYMAAYKEVPVLSEEEVRTNLKFLANLTEFIVKQALANRELDRNRQRASCLLRIAEYRIRSVAEFLDYALAEAVALSGSHFGYIAFYSEEKNELTIKSEHGNSGAPVHSERQELTIPHTAEATGHWARALRERRPVVLNSPDSEAASPRVFPLEHPPFTSALTIPVFSDDRIVGLIGLANKHTSYTDADVVDLTLLMNSSWRRVEAETARAEHLAIEAQLRHSSKLASLGTLAAGVAHEINNPLAIVKGYCSLLMADEAHGWDVKARQVLEKVIHSTDRIAEIVSGLRKFARADADRAQVLEVDTEVRDVLKFTENLLKKSGIAIEVDFRTKGSHIFADAGKYQQVIMNLLTNARDAVKDVRNGLLRIETWDDPESAFVRVSDNGCGIPVEHLERIFDPFFTTKDVGEGTGLGLSISSRIIESFGGSLTAESVVGLGSSFTIRMPRFTPKAHYPVRESTRCSAAEQPLVTGRVLVVDDEPEILEILASELQGLGLETQTEVDPEKALELLRAEHFDYCVTDLKMPVMSGDELMEKVKLAGRRTRFVVLSGTVLADYTPAQHERVRKYADGSLEKPFSRDGILRALNAINAARPERV